MDTFQRYVTSPFRAQNELMRLIPHRFLQLKIKSGLMNNIVNRKDTTLKYHKKTINY